MSDDTNGGRIRRLGVEALTRVEGEGGLVIEIRDDPDGGAPVVHDVRLRIFEPPRFIEGVLRGRSFTEPPDITARICGICPVAYQMSACQALEALCGVTVDEPIRDLRHLLYCGEWIESHLLHLHLLHAPDFLGYESGLAMAADHRAEVERGLALKQLGNDIVEVVGGRAVHPVNIRVGGFNRAPSLERMSALAERIGPAIEEAVDVVRWVATFPIPDHSLPDDTVLVALRHPTEYPILDGRLVSTNGLDIGPEEFPDHIVEEQVAHSTALHARLVGTDEPYLVGPLARFALASDRLAPRAAALAEEVGLTRDERNPFRSGLVRAIETVHVLEVAHRLTSAYTLPERSSIEVTPVAGVGSGWSEAPRGVLWHRYEIDADGLVVAATIVPPTAQNQTVIEHDLWQGVERSLDLDDASLEAMCERIVRNYDPCISCATHFLDLRVRRSSGRDLPGDGPPHAVR